MGDEAGSEAATTDDEVPELSAEQIVDADTAMLLDLGGAELLAEGIAAQSGGGDTVVDRHLEPATEREPDPDTEQV